jgi:hypothetical protein
MGCETGLAASQPIFILDSGKAASRHQHYNEIRSSCQIPDRAAGRLRRHTLPFHGPKTRGETPRRRDLAQTVYKNGLSKEKEPVQLSDRKHWRCGGVGQTCIPCGICIALVPFVSS